MANTECSWFSYEILKKDNHFAFYVEFGGLFVCGWSCNTGCFWWGMDIIHIACFVFCFVFTGSPNPRYRNCNYTWKKKAADVWKVFSLGGLASVYLKLSLNVFILFISMNKSQKGRGCVLGSNVLVNLRCPFTCYLTSNTALQSLGNVKRCLLISLCVNKTMWTYFTKIIINMCNVLSDTC